jgi:lambda family phage tail tape measure protein
MARLDSGHKHGVIDLTELLGLNALRHNRIDFRVRGPKVFQSDVSTLGISAQHIFFNIKANGPGNGIGHHQRRRGQKGLLRIRMNAAVKISASVSGQQAVEQLRSSMDRMRDSASSFAKLAIGGFIGVQAIQQIASLAGNVLNAADEMSKLSQRTGVSVETLSELSYAANLSGSSIDEVVAAMTKLATKATNAATGNKAAAGSFAALGVAVTDANGALKTQEQLFDEVTAKIRGINDPTLKAAVAVEFFGKSGTKLIPLINSMDEARQEARDMGAVFSKDFAKSSEEFNDNISRMGYMLKGLTMTILNDVIPGLNRMMEAMGTAAKTGNSVLGAGLKQLINNMGLDYKNLDNTITELEAKIARTEKMREVLSKDTITNRINNFFSRDLSIVESQIKNFKEQLNQLKELREKANKEDASGNTPAQDQAIQDGLALVNQKTEATKKLTEAERLAKSQEQERARIIENLSDTLFKMKEGEDALLIAKLKRLNATDAEIEQVQRLLMDQGELNLLQWEQEENEKKINEARKRFLDDTRQAIRESEQLADAGRRVWDETRTPLEKYLERLEELEQLHQRGGISFETMQRAIKKAHDEMESLGEKGTDVFSELKNAVDGWGRDSANAIVDFVMGAKNSFSDLVNSILADIARMLVYQSITQPIAQAVGAFFGPVPQANGGVWAGGNLQAFAAGGVVTRPTMFPMANGGTGLMGEAGPEAIMPLRRGIDGKLGITGSSTSVVVNNYGNDKASARESVDSRGNRRIEVTIGELVSSEVKRAGSSMHNSFRETFGAQPALVGR